MLVYVIDMAGTDNRLPWDDYKSLRSEISQYDAALLDRPSLVLANKMDEMAAVENLPKFIKKTRVKPIPVSALDQNDPGVARFKQSLWDILKPVAKGVWQAGEARASQVPMPEADGDFISEEALKHAPFLDLSRKLPKK